MEAVPDSAAQPGFGELRRHPHESGIQYAVSLPYGTMADIRILTAYWIIRFRG
jgi:hypothetical protein